MAEILTYNTFTLLRSLILFLFKISHTYTFFTIISLSVTFSQSYPATYQPNIHMSFTFLVFQDFSDQEQDFPRIRISRNKHTSESLSNFNFLICFYLLVFFRTLEVGDVVVHKDPTNLSNLLVRRIAALQDWEMASTDENDVPFTLVKNQCWVLADNEKLNPQVLVYFLLVIPLKSDCFTPPFFFSFLIALLVHFLVFSMIFGL